MKTLITVLVSALVGSAVGFLVGYRYSQRHITSDTVRQLVESGESSDALIAATSARAIGFIDSGQPREAVEALSRPIAHYYAVYATSSSTNEQRFKLRGMIEGLANTNQIVAARIAGQRIDR